jgi:hypothetical protein
VRSDKDSLVFTVPQAEQVLLDGYQWSITIGSGANNVKVTPSAAEAVPSGNSSTIVFDSAEDSYAYRRKNLQH